MALSLSNFLYLCSSFIFLRSTLAETRTYNFSVGWVYRNPDGLYTRPVIGINGQWPLPRMDATIGDRVVVNVHNELGNQSTSLHFHGLFMNGTNEMDGVVGVTQCGIPPGSSFTYDFTVDQSGTYWYHSHVDGQYPDGLRGPFIIQDPDSPYEDQYDEELVLTLSDWYHDEMQHIIPNFITVTNPTGAEPIPQAALMNDTQNLQIKIEPNKTYFLRLINLGAFAGQYFWIEGHTFRVVEVDGVWHEAVETDMIYIAAAQRYGLLLTTKNETDINYAIVGAMDQDLFDTVPDTLNPNVTSFLVYNSAANMPTPALLDQYDPFDDFDLVPIDGERLFTEPDQSVVLAVAMNNLGNGANYAFFNDITYVRPSVPSIYTVVTSQDLAANSQIYGSHTNAFVLGYQQVTEIVVNNHDSGKHPFHLHGHNFQAIARGEDNSGDYVPSNTTLPSVPMRRDTFMVRSNGHIVMRFRSDNPGVWLFHCHIEWHVDQGLVATIVEAPLELQQTLTIPADHYAACAAASPPVATAGNAAANTIELLDLTGQPSPPAPLPSGFTPKGIVALVFSCIAAFLGLAAVTWYGLGELNEIEKAREERHVDGIAAATVHLVESKGTKATGSEIVTAEEK